MFNLVITEKGGEPKKVKFDKTEITIGRVKGNDIILPKGNVSKRHSRILLKDGKFIIVDLRSTNGTYVNGRKITSPLVLQPSDKVYVGDFILQVEPPAGAQPQAAAPQPAKPPPPRRRGAAPPPPGQRGPAPSGGRPAAPPSPQPPAAEEEPPPMDEGMGPAAVAPAAPPPRRRSRSAPPPRQSRDSQGSPKPPTQPPEQDFEPAPRQEQPARQAPEPRPQPAASPPPAGAEQRQQQGRRAAAPDERRRKKAGSPKPAARRDEEATPIPSGRGQISSSDPRRQKLTEIQKIVHDKLIEAMDLRRLDIEELADEELWDKTENTIADIVTDMDSKGEIPSFVDKEQLITDVLNEALGLGPLEEFVDDESVTEIMVNHAEQIYLEREGRLVLSEKVFSSQKAVMGVIERIVAPIGRRIDESSPLVDARLKDGSRVNAIIPPLALKGPALTIRKFNKEMLGPKELIGYGTITNGMVHFLKMCVEARKNMVISGGTGSGKTTTLNIVSNFIPEGERVITVEDAAELQMHHDHWIQLESRPPNIEGKGEIAIRDLVKNTLRMRPDRIIVGECRSGEALDMLQAMNTGHDGSLTTAHANSPRDVLARLETMVLMSGMELPIKAIREQIAAAIDIIVQQTRFSDGTRKITNITEVTGMEGDVLTLQDIFVFRQEGFDENDKVAGRFVATGFIPRFYEDLQRRGIPVDMSIFRE